MWDEDCRISAASGFSRYISREVITRTVAYIWGLALQVSLSLNTDSWKQIPFASVGVVFLSLSVHRRIPNAFFFYNVPTYSSLDEANHISLLSAA